VAVEISVVVPLYNEADNVLPLAREVAAALAGLDRGWELVLVDDASTDGTWERIAEARRADSRVRGLRHRRNAGQSAAVWTGLTATDSPILCTLDGDLQNDPADLPAMIAALDKVDFVSGMRLERQDSWVRKVSSRIARSARRRALGVNFRDTGCAIRAFKREALAGVFPFNGLHRFLPILVHGGGFKTLEVPVRHRPRVAGVSKYGVWNRLGRGVYDLIAISWYQKRRYLPPGYIELQDTPPAAKTRPARVPESGVTA
jgi:glycosyltransferase involved in cell wall biosynthesis